MNQSNSIITTRNLHIVQSIEYNDTFKTLDTPIVSIILKLHFGYLFQNVYI